MIPANLYGPGDNFDLETSHVMGALIRKFAEAAVNNTDVTVWGDGQAYREFLHSDDLADATEFKGKIIWDKSKPNGATRKVLSSKTISELGWKPKIDLGNGIRRSVAEFHSKFLH